MKAPLSQTLFLTEDGSLYTSNAVTIPPIVIGIPPTFGGNPSVQSDGTPQVGEQLLGIDATVLNLGSAILRRAWLLGSTVLVEDASFTPDDDQTYTFRNQLVVAGVVVASVSVDVQVSAATVTPTPTPAAFSAQPQLLTEASPRVGDVTGVYAGEANRPFDTIRLFRNGVDFADASALSIKWEQTGEYFVEVRLKDSTVTARTQTIVVQAAIVSNRTPPRFFFPADRAPGTNPVEVLFASDDDTINKNTDSLYYEYTNNGVTKSATIPLAQVEFNAGSYITNADFEGFSAGSFSIHGEFRGPEGAPSGFGNTLTDTLNAKTLPAATTTFDELNKSRYAILSADMRTVSFTEGVNSEQPVVGTTARSDKRFVEFVPVDVPDNASNRWNVGIAPADAQIDASKFVYPAGAIHIEAPLYDGTFRAQVRASIADGTGSLILLFTPATSGSNGTIELLFKGVRVAAIVSHALASAKFMFNGPTKSSVRANAGQDTFRQTPSDASFVRWN